MDFKIVYKHSGWKTGDLVKHTISQKIGLFLWEAPYWDGTIPVIFFNNKIGECNSDRLENISLKERK